MRVKGTGFLPHDSHRLDSSQSASHPLVLEASPNAIVGVDREGRITYANAQAAATFGYPRSDLIGKPLELLIPEGVRDRHRDHHMGFHASPRARPMGIGVELAGRRKDGTEFPAEISLTPVSRDPGMEVYATVVDITVRKAAERGLAESERRFRAVLESSPNAIVGVDRSARIIYVNPRTESAFGYAHDELIGQAIELLIPARVRDQHVGHRDDFLANPVARPMGIGLDLAGRRKDGSEFPVEISLSPLSTDHGMEIFATVVDITARKAAETQLLQAQKLESIGRLAGGIAHDFNNMMFAIRGFADMLTEDLSPDRRDTFDFGAALASVDTIAVAAERASALTAQLLAFSRRQVVSLRPLDINTSVRAIEPMLRRLIGENIKLSLALDPGIGAVFADPGQIDQILMNLVVNARDAISEGGSVTIATQSVLFDEAYSLEHFEVVPGSYVQLAVSDSGAGWIARPASTSSNHSSRRRMSAKGPGSDWPRSTGSSARREATSGSTRSPARDQPSSCTSPGTTHRLRRSLRR